MALADPLSVTIDGDVISLPRVSTGENKSVYRASDASVELVASHTYGKRTRRAVRLNHSKVAVDPLVPSTSVPYSASITLVIDQPIVGYTQDELADIVTGLLVSLGTGTPTLMAKVIGGQN